MRNRGRTGGRTGGSEWEKGSAGAVGGPIAAIAAALLVLLPGTAAGQDDQLEPPGAGLELTAYAGLILPMSVLGSQGDTLEADLSTKPAFAAGADVWFGGGFGLGLMGGIASPEVSLTAADRNSGMQEDADLGGVDFLHGEAVLLWRPELGGSAGVVLPYFGAGVGVRRLSFEADSGFEETTDVTLVLNAGTHLPLSDRVHLRLDVRDLISTFEGGPFADSNRQHDVLAQVGLGIGL